MTTQSSQAFSQGLGGVARQPMSLTWIGGGNNLASNPADWTPGVAPKPGDTLLIGSGTIEISGNTLAGDTLTTKPFGGKIDIVTEGGAKLNLAVGPNVTTNISVHDTLTLNVSALNEGKLNTTGGTIKFIGVNKLQSNQVFNDKLTGNATLSLFGGQGEGDLTEINGAVGRGLTFALSGISELKIDQPTKFQGLIDLSRPGIINDVTFVGLHATSADLLDGILLLFNGNRLVDATRVVTSGTVQLHQASAGVILSAGLSSEVPSGATVIPLHM